MNFTQQVSVCHDAFFCLQVACICGKMLTQNTVLCMRTQVHITHSNIQYYVHACIPAHRCLHIHTHTHTHPLTCTQTNTCTHTHTHHKYMTLYTCSTLLTHVDTHSHKHMQIQACMYVRNYAQIHIQTYCICTKYILCLCIFIRMYTLACIAWQLKCN